MLVLEYIKWENFHKVIRSAMSAFENCNYNVEVNIFLRSGKYQKCLND